MLLVLCTPQMLSQASTRVLPALTRSSVEHMSVRWAYLLMAISGQYTDCNETIRSSCTQPHRHLLHMTHVTTCS